MYTNDDKDTAKIADRLIAGVIGGLCGYFFGVVLAFLVVSFVGRDFGLPWFVALGFGVFAFLSPSRSTELWSEIWAKALELLGKLALGWRR